MKKVYNMEFTQFRPLRGGSSVRSGKIFSGIYCLNNVKRMSFISGVLTKLTGLTTT